MNQQSTIRAFLLGQPKETIMTLTPSQFLNRQLQGDQFKIISGNAPLQPAAVGTAKMPAFGMQDVKSDIQAKQGAKKRAAIEPEYTPEEEPVIVKKAKPAKPAAKKSGEKKPGKYVKKLLTDARIGVVCEKTNSYWPSATQCSKSLKCAHSLVRAHLAGTHPFCKGHLLRVATDAERIAGKVIK